MTTILVGTSSALADLRFLRLESFSRAAEYLMRMFRLAPRISSLFLKVLRPEHNSWQVQVFAHLCTSLVSLIVNDVLETGASVIPSFPTGPPTIAIHHLRGAIGHNVSTVLNALVPPCPIDEFLQALRRTKPMTVRNVILDNIYFATEKYGGDFYQLEKTRGIHFHVRNGWDMGDDGVRRDVPLLHRSFVPLGPRRVVRARALICLPPSRAVRLPQAAHPPVAGPLAAGGLETRGRGACLRRRTWVEEEGMERTSLLWNENRFHDLHGRFRKNESKKRDSVSESARWFAARPSQLAFAP